MNMVCASISLCLPWLLPAVLCGFPSPGLSPARRVSGHSHHLYALHQSGSPRLDSVDATPLVGALQTRPSLPSLLTVVGPSLSPQVWGFSNGLCYFVSSLELKTIPDCFWIILPWPISLDLLPEMSSSCYYNLSFMICGITPTEKVFKFDCSFRVRLIGFAYYT